MIFRNLLRKATALSFKPVEGGYLLRTSHPWLLGTGPHYIVSEAQKDALIDVIPPRRPLLFATLLIAWLLMFSFGENYLTSTIFAHRSTPIEHVCIMIAGWAVFYVMLVVMIRRRLRRMAPILAKAVLAG